MRKRIFIYLVAFELFVMAVIGYKIYHKTSISIDPLWAKDYTFGNSSKFKYYYEPKPGINISESVPLDGPGPVKYMVNQDTLYSVKNFSIKKPDKTFRIAVLGNSFTAGIYVNTDKIWPALLETRLNQNLKCSNISQVEVINLGVPGYDAVYEAERFRIRGVKYNPDLVLWYQTEFKKITEATMPIYFSRLSAAEKNGRLKEEWSEAKYFVEWDMGKNAVRQSLGDANIFNYQLTEIKNLDNTYKGKLGFILDPRTVSVEEKKQVKNLIDARKNSFLVDTLRDIYQFGGVFKADAHPNEKGQSIIAEDISNYLSKNRIIPCTN